jgi:hypothetical protein
MSLFQQPAKLDLSPTLQCFPQGDGVDIFEIAPHRQSARDAGNSDTQGLDDFRKIQSGRFPIDGRIRGHNNFPDSAAPNAIEQFSDAKSIRTNAIERR